MRLFQEIDFKSHSGLDLSWKIECDCISKKEWKCLAKMIMDYETRPFCSAVGIPRGGVVLGSYLNLYSTQNNDDPYLIVDDVLTTGGSMVEYREKHFKNKNVIGWVVFARNKPQDWVNSLFQMPSTPNEKL